MSNMENEFDLNRTLFRLKNAGLSSSVIADAFDLSTQQVAGFLAAHTRKTNATKCSPKVVKSSKK